MKTTSYWYAVPILPAIFFGRVLGGGAGDVYS